MGEIEQCSHTQYAKELSFSTVIEKRSVKSALKGQDHGVVSY